MTDLPAYADTIVVGGGTSGSVLAARLAEGSDRSVLVLEAGPDYGALSEGCWPADLLDPRVIPPTHQWGYTSAARFGRPDLVLQRARVIGGCSAHNGMAAVWGHADDYDAWANAGNPGWDAASLLPVFREANQKMRVSTPGRAELGPFHEAVLDAAPAAGIPLIDDLNDLWGPNGMVVPPVNAPDGVRWNTALAYLDPTRRRTNLSIHGDVLVDRVIIEQGCATGVVVAGSAGSAVIGAGQVVIAAGAYESPAILLRSGVGDPAALRALGIEVRQASPGVGANLHDHVAYEMQFEGTEPLFVALIAFSQRHLLREEGVIAKLRVVDDVAFDLHAYPVANPGLTSSERAVVLPIAVMTPYSRRALRIVSRDPRALPVIDHGYLTDPAGHDVSVLTEGIRLMRRLAAAPPLANLIGHETLSGGIESGGALAAHIRANAAHYYHPVGTCKMGPATDPAAVVDAWGRVHGVAGLRVADCSIMPVVPRANTNIPAVVIGEKIASSMILGM